MKIRYRRSQTKVARLTLAIFGLTLAMSMPSRAQLGERTDPQRELEVGRETARLFEKANPLTRDKAMAERVARIGNALVAVLPEKAYPYEFKVVASSVINAQTLPGGFIYFNEGLVARLPSDDALAFVMGHEVTHAAHRHWHRIMERMKAIDAIGIAGSVLTGTGAFGNLLHGLVGLTYSRENEADADKNGIELMWAAGFDPHGAVEACQLLADIDKHNGAPIFMRSHPAGKDRLAKAEAEEKELRTRIRPSSIQSSTQSRTQSRTQSMIIAGSDNGAATDLSSVSGVLPMVVCSPNRWMPLAPGNVWTYTTVGDVNSASYTVRVVSPLSLANATIYRCETLLGHGSPVPFQYLATATQIWRRNRIANPQSAWKLEYELAADSPTAGAPAAASEDSVTVPAGTFTRILKLHEPGEHGGYDLWFALDVGLIKRVSIDSGLAEVLASYKVQPPAKAPSP